MTPNYNELFRNNPFEFINKYTVDNTGWFGKQQSVREAGWQYMLASDNAKFCRMHFDPSDGFLGLGVETVTAKFVGGTGIGGYWVPFSSGSELPGYADVKRLNPPTPFVFTPAMNGCAFVVTPSPLGSNYMRVYHNQHPDSNGIMELIRATSGSIISIYSFEEYGRAELPAGVGPVAFNFMYYRNGAWNYVSQPQEFTFPTIRIELPRRQIGYASIRSVF